MKIKFVRFVISREVEFDWQFRVASDGFGEVGRKYERQVAVTRRM